MKVLLSIIFLIHLAVASNLPDGYKLELVQVLFRHGDRATDKMEIYKTDPYDEIFRKHGYGQLTKIGHEREYKVGQMLKKRYGGFLGEFNNSDVFAYSTDIDRTKMSLQLVLAGLYPPSKENSWNPAINWIPIPTHYRRASADFLFIFTCPAYQKLYKEAQQSPEIQEKLKPYAKFLNYLRNKTELTDHTPLSVYLIYGNIRAALSYGLSLPEWCTEQDYKIINEIAPIALKTLTHTIPMKRAMAGVIIETFLKNVNKKPTGDDNKKIYLYSAHDINVASFTNVHNFTGIPAIPDYGSTIIFEKLRGEDNQVYIRMFLWTGVGEKLIPLKLEQCQEICLLSDYTNIVNALMPDNFTRQCISKNNSCRQRSMEDTVDALLQRSYLFTGNDLASFKHMTDFIAPSA